MLLVGCGYLLAPRDSFLGLLIANGAIKVENKWHNQHCIERAELTLLR